MLLALLDVYVCCDEAFTVCCPVNDSSSSLVYVVNSSDFLTVQFHALFEIIV